MPYDLLHIPNLILNLLYNFIPFLYKLFLLQRTKWIQSSKNNGKDNEFEYKFLLICIFLNL